MSRYIDADALINAINNAINNGGIITDTAKFIRDFPHADVRENVHAHWEDKWHIVFHVNLPICSSCGFYAPFRCNFCPNCGAEMDERGDDAK